MKLFLAIAEVRVSQYMGSSEHMQFTHIVQADDALQAHQAVEAHYQQKTSEYSVYYSVDSVNVMETLIASEILRGQA